MKFQSCFEVISNIALDLLFPRHCAVCGRTLGGYTEVPLCDLCICKPLKPKVVRDDRYYFTEAVGVLKYEEYVRKAMIKYKFKAIKYYSKAYSYIMNRAISDRPYFKDALMCCVPVSVTREREYSQTKVIAEELNSMWNNTFIPDLLYRCRMVSQLSKMKLPERRFFIKDSIDLNPVYDVYDKDILVIDDIFTSGTTANECARILKMYGARNVYILCPCYD